MQMITNYWSLFLFLLPEITPLKFAPLLDSECLEDSYCEKVKYYPLQKIQNTVAQHIDKFGAFFGEDVIPPKNEPKMSINNRGSFDRPAAEPSSDSNLCDFVTVNKFPKRGTTIENEQHYIINDGQSYKQGIRVELCTNERAKCAFSEGFPNGYECTCVQVYNYRYLLSYVDENVVKKAFLMPSYCKSSITLKEPTVYT